MRSEPGSEDEQKAIEEHLKLLTEKAALVRKLDYLNSLADLHETRDRLAGVRRKLHEMTSREGSSSMVNSALTNIFRKQ